ncbi:MAG: hypothetical protein JWR30_593, partial [Conexibacter sp.]|nr:hypothetical protein [Conexibacter sp.]
MKRSKLLVALGIMAMASLGTTGIASAHTPSKST